MTPLPGKGVFSEERVDWQLHCSRGAVAPRIWSFLMSFQNRHGHRPMSRERFKGIKEGRELCLFEIFIAVLGSDAEDD